MPQPASDRPPSRTDRDEAPAGAPLDLGHLTGLVGYALKRARHAVSRNFDRHFGDLDIRPTQLGVLATVGRHPGCRPSEVGAALGIQRANLVPLLNGLEERGLVVRSRAVTDRRSHALRLTSAGEALLAELRRREAVHEAEIARLISETDRHRLVRLLARVQEACEVAAVSGPRED